MQRHRQKDAEAGGEGLGNLATRKRLWKDSHGRVVNASRIQKSATTSIPSTLKADVPAEKVAVDDSSYALMSPPASTSSSALEPVEHVPQAKFTYPEAAWEAMDMNFAPPSEFNELDLWGDSSWANQPFQAMMGTPDDLPDNEVTFPDTSKCHSRTFQMSCANRGSDFIQCFTSDTPVLQLAVRK